MKTRNILTGILCVALILIILQSCGPVKKVIVNREVDNERDGKMLLGTQTKSQFSKSPYSDWYDKEHAEYAMDKEAIKDLRKEKLNSYNISVFLGTWCEDSHREFPRLMKILEELNYPEQKLTIVAVNRKKESPSGEETRFNIQYVPTIIVKKYGKEIGRIIEAPNSGWLERDLLEIIKKDNQSVIGEIFGK
ncbi:MAG: thioredoxin family protein [Flavobacteriaceae bacterium]|jgi:thiol-disulfide isomerase/thioredoxin|nr:thioredoxin family protein [Flavobacteriaceae bacterium]